mgnify:CR=1 FL=1
MIFIGIIRGDPEPLKTHIFEPREYYQSIPLVERSLFIEVFENMEHESVFIFMNTVDIRSSSRALLQTMLKEWLP